MTAPCTGRATRGAMLLGVLALSLVIATTHAHGEERSRVPRFGLLLEYEHFSYFEQAGPTLDQRNALTAIPKVDWTPGPAELFLRASVLLRQDFDEEERSRIDAWESFLRWEGNAWTVQLGRQFITWGRADAVRPTDVFKRHDWIDLIENREEPIDAVKLELLRGSWALETVWAPIFNADIVSFRPENRWTRLPAEAVIPGLGPVRLAFREDRRQRPPATLASGQVGTRLTTSAGGWDFAAMYYYGYDRIPTIIERHLETFDPATGTATVRLVPIHRRIHVVGGDVATAIAGWGLRGEAAYTHPPDQRGGNDPYVRLTVGADRSFTRLPIGESLWVIGQYALDTARESRDLLQDERNPRLHPFRHAFLVHGTWKYVEWLRLDVKSFLNLEAGDYVVQPELSWQPIDALTVTVGADFLGGRRNTFFGQYEDNDRVRFRVTYAF